MHNNNDFGPYGNIGLAVRGIQIHIPLSANFTLVFWCPTLVEEVQRAAVECRAALARSSGAALISDPLARQAAVNMRADLENRLPEISEMAEKVISGQGVSCTNENITFFDALQIAQAERHVMSADQDFSLARRMIAIVISAVLAAAVLAPPDEAIQR